MTEWYETSIDEGVSGELTVREDDSLISKGSAGMRLSLDRDNGREVYRLHTGGYGPSFTRDIYATIDAEEFGDGGENPISRLNIDPESVFEYEFMEEFPVRDNPVTVRHVRVDKDGDEVDVSIGLRYRNNVGGTGYSTRKAVDVMEEETGIDVRRYLDDELGQDAF